MLDSDLSPMEQCAERAEQISANQLNAIHTRTDRLFAILMFVQWVLGIVAAVWISPYTWTGELSETHFHVSMAVFLGGAITALPIFLIWKLPGSTLTRHVTAIGQMLTSALLIHLSGGRIETHFHIFGSLAFLACYRDARVMITATIVIAADHFVRGLYWPESVYGVMSGASFRFLEHAGWVLFEDTFLLLTIRQSLDSLKRTARHQSQLESTNAIVEEEVLRRTIELSEAIQQAASANRELAKSNETLQDKNKELDQFTYIASHDLQEPVRKLVSFSSLLEQDIDCELNEDAKRDLEFIVDAAKRMKNLVQALLELSRVGRAAIKHDPIDLNQCADDALSSLQIRVGETNAVICRDELPTIVGDRTMITQLYQNLIGNALKFIDNDQPKLHLTAVRNDNHWTLGVKDNGIGMKPEHAERIFQPFQRLHNRAQYEGTGIGLSICRKTVERHQGTIWVQSNEGEGAHFLFTIPLANTESLAVPLFPAQDNTASLVNTSAV